jgi:hypothetical protein
MVMAEELQNLKSINLDRIVTLSGRTDPVTIGCTDTADVRPRETYQRR